jgi:Tol biopolymer transport system component
VTGGTEEAPHTKIFVFDLEGRTLFQAEHQAWLAGFAWSADNRHFIYGVLEGDALETARPSLAIGDAESVMTVRIDDAFDPRWSPDGTRFTYLASPNEEAAIEGLDPVQITSLPAGVRPLAWALGGEALLVATSYQQQEFGASYQAHLMNVASAAMTRVPQLDNGTQFWLSRDGRTAAFLGGPAERTEGGVTISVLDLATGAVTPVEGAVIGYPSEGIPPDHIAFSPDGAYLYWVDVVTTSGQEGLSGAVHRAKSDGSELTELGLINAALFAFSPDRTRVLYFDGSAVGVAGIDGGDVHTLAEGVSVGWPPAVWRPAP